jgi:RNA polymerase sigma-70 factor (ECF subfamily)
MVEAVISNQAIQLVDTHTSVEAIVRQYTRLIYRIAYSVLRNHHDAEDVTQETFVHVLRHRRKLEGVHDAKAYLARIAWRAAVKRRKGKCEISLDESRARVAILQLRSQLASAEEFTLGREMADLLQVFISAQPPSLRDVLTLSILQELTSEQIAEVLEISESSVRSRMFRARQALKTKLAALEGKYGSTR